MKREESPLKQKKDEGQENIIEDLGLLNVRIMRVLRKNDISPSESRIVSERVSQIRAMLSAWELLEREGKRKPTLATTIRHLRKSFLELEGMVKEARNDRFVNG